MLNLATKTKNKFIYLFEMKITPTLYVKVMDSFENVGHMLKQM